MLSVIVPCYNEEPMIPVLYDHLKAALDGVISYEVLFIDDGSTDKTLEMIKKLSGSHPEVKYLSFSRNFGKEAAMYAGICNASGDYVVTMDADLQDPPSLLPRMVSILDSGEYDSVATRRVNRKGEPAVRSFFARCFYCLIRKVSDVEIVDGARDYRMMNRKMTDALKSLTEYNRFSKGLYAWLGFKTRWLEYENSERAAGETKWSFWKLLRYAIDGIISFSQVPLYIASWFGVGMTLFSFLILLVIIVRRLAFGDPVAGWASTVCIIIFIGGIQLFCMGIIGQYLAKTYLEVKRRPVYLIAESNFQSE